MLQISARDYQRLFGTNDAAAARLRNFARGHACVANHASQAILFRTEFMQLDRVFRAWSDKSITFQQRRGPAMEHGEADDITYSAVIGGVFCCFWASTHFGCGSFDDERSSPRPRDGFGSVGVGG